MGYAVEDLRMSSGGGDVWIGVPVWCYTGCNRNLVANLVKIQTDSTVHWWLAFITTGNSAGSQA